MRLRENTYYKVCAQRGDTFREVKIEDTNDAEISMFLKDVLAEHLSVTNQRGVPYSVLTVHECGGIITHKILSRKVWNQSPIQVIEKIKKAIKTSGV